MVYGCGNTCVKFLLFTVNLLICLCGALIAGFSLWANLDKDFIHHLQKFASEADLTDIEKYRASLWVFVGVGCLLFLVGFLGCCGTACESTPLLSLYFVIVLILAVIAIGAAVYAMVNRDGFQSSLKGILQKADEEGKQDLLEPIEQMFDCCGSVVETMNLYNCTTRLPGKVDCYTAMWDWLNNAGSAAVIVAFVLTAVELISLIFTCILCRAFRERSPGYYA